MHAWLLGDNGHLTNLARCDGVFVSTHVATNAGMRKWRVFVAFPHKDVWVWEYETKEDALSAVAFIADQLAVPNVVGLVRRPAEAATRALLHKADA